MFGSKQINVRVSGGNHSHTHKHTTKEIKAPTDESLRLLDEFKSKAEASVVARGLYKCSNTGIEIAWMRRGFTFDHPFDEVINYRLRINEKELTGSIEVDDNVTELVMLDRLIEKVTKHLVAETCFERFKEVTYSTGIGPFGGKRYES